LVNKPAKGKRSKTRSKFKRVRKRLTIGAQLADFAVGSKVHVDIDSSVHSGLPDSRFQGLTGTVAGKQGKAFVVEVYQGNQLNKLVTVASHLKQAKGASK
jgi:large subunit ribosomal protein L21e